MNKCNQCIYQPKCKDITADGRGCGDYKNRGRFIELPFCVNQLIFFIKNETKRVPVSINGEAYFKLEDASKVASTLFRGDILCKYIEPADPFGFKTVPQYFATKEAAESALAEMKKNK